MTRTRKSSPERPAAAAERESGPCRIFVLDDEHYDAFVRTLDNPPAPGPKLRALLRRTPAWQK